MTLDLLAASDGNGEAVRATVTGIRSAGATVINVDALTNWPASFIATSGSLLADGTLDPATALVFEGHTSGSTIVIDSIAPGYTDNGNTVSQVVIVKPATHWADTLKDDLSVSLNNDGTLKDNIITTAKIDDGAVTNSKLSTTSGELGGTWATWTPTYTNITVGNGTVVAKYTQIGKTVIGRWSLILGSTSSIGSNPNLTAPVSTNADYNSSTDFWVGGASILDSSGPAGWNGYVFMNNSNTLRLLSNNSQTDTRNASLTATKPFTWATGDIISITFTYEAA